MSPYLVVVGGGVLGRTAGVPLNGHTHYGPNQKGLPNLWCKLPCQELRGVGGIASRTVPPGYWAPYRSI